MTDERIMATIKPDGECWQPEIEKMPREQLEALQVKKLKESIKVALNSPFYKKRLSPSPRSKTCVTTILMVLLAEAWMMPSVFTLPAVQLVIPVWWSILSTTSAHGPI